MLIVAMRISRERSTQRHSGVKVRKSYRELPMASRRNWLDLQGDLSNAFPNFQVKGPTVGERDKRKSIVFELCLRDRTWKLHRPLGNKPSLGPEHIGERAKVPRVPMHREGVNRHGGSLWEVTNGHWSASHIW